MKKVIITSPTFTPSTKTIDTKIVGFDIRKLYAIINQTTGNLIYATSVQGKGFTSVSGSVIVLEFDTTSMSSTDTLQILYDDDEDTQWLQNIYESVDTLGFLTGLRGPAANLRVTVTDGSNLSITNTPNVSVTNTPNIGTITTVTSVTAVANITNVGSFAANPQVPSTINIGAIQSNINNIQINIT
jgi:hypothetical protein